MDSFLTSCQGLAKDDHVGLDARFSVMSHLKTSPAESRLDLIHNKEDIVCLAEVRDCFEVSSWRNTNTV
jgi:hypothetical protein